MTPNEKALLAELTKAKRGSAVTMSKRVNLSIGYTQALCKGLEEKGALKQVAPGRWPVYTVKK